MFYTSASEGLIINVDSLKALNKLTALRALRNLSKTERGLKQIFDTLQTAATT